MRTRLLNAVLFAALAASGVRLWQIVREPPPTLPAGAAAANAYTAGTTNREKKDAVGEIRPDGYNLIVARDMFSPSRGVVPPAPAPAVIPPPKPAPVPKLTLAGVVIIDGEKTAYLQEGTQEARPRKVREKESFAGGVVGAIRPDGVTFLFGGSEINIPLRLPKSGADSARVVDTGDAAPRAESAATMPRRLPTPVPARPMTPAPVLPSVVTPGGPGGGGFGDEEFPEESQPGGEAPSTTEEESHE